MKAFGVGRFVRDPELKDVGNTTVCEFSLAINEFRKVNGERVQNTHFFDFVVWDKAAELIASRPRKGTQLEFYASPKQERWEKDGQQRSKVVFRIDDFNFIGSAPKAEPVEVAAQSNEVDDDPVF